jgi:DNA-binding beta-propeller fold protein YncE
LYEFRSPHGIDVGNDGRIYVADSRNYRVMVYKQDGTFSHKFGSRGTGNTQFSFPRGIAVDPEDQSIWIADSAGQDMIKHLSNTGAPLGIVSGPGIADNQLTNPFDLEVDNQFVYVADTKSHRVKIFNKDTKAYVGYLGGGDSRTFGQLSMPQGLDLRGNILYVAELGNERITTFNLLGLG